MKKQCECTTYNRNLVISTTGNYSCLCKGALTCKQCSIMMVNFLSYCLGLMFVVAISFLVMQDEENDHLFY